MVPTFSSTLKTFTILITSLMSLVGAGPLKDLECAINGIINRGQCFLEYQKDLTKDIDGDHGCCILAKYQFCLMHHSLECGVDLQRLANSVGRESLGDCSGFEISSVECLYFFYPLAVVFIGMFMFTLACLSCLHCCRSRGPRRQGTTGGNNRRRQPANLALRQDPYNSRVGGGGGASSNVYQETTRPLVYVAPSAPILASDNIPPPSYEEAQRKY